VRFQSPPMMRIVCGLPRLEGAAGRPEEERDIRNIDDGGTGRAQGRTAKQAHVTTAAARTDASATPH